MKILVASLALLTLSGCSMIPSFWDDNESMLAVEVRYAVDKLQCDQPQSPQVNVIKNKLTHFELYSESRGSDDIGEMIDIMKGTVDEFHSRGEGSKMYCNIKKKLMEKQASDIAEAVMGRY